MLIQGFFVKRLKIIVVMLGSASGLFLAMWLGVVLSGAQGSCSGPPFSNLGLPYEKNDSACCAMPGIFIKFGKLLIL